MFLHGSVIGLSSPPHTPRPLPLLPAEDTLSALGQAGYEFSNPQMPTSAVFLCREYRCTVKDKEDMKSTININLKL